MKAKDKNYLSLQFWYKIYTKNGKEFQTFFEDIMDKAYPDFQKIKPYGREGDAGNDGYRKKLGIYYQVYAPETPQIKEREAVSKLKKDFETLKKEWDQVSTINKYYFVYNDKNMGSTQKLEATITDLQEANKNIEFEILNARKLEQILYNIDEADLMLIGFDIDSRRAIENTYQYLKEVEVALDLEDANLAALIHNQVENIIKSFKDDDLEFEYELLRARCLQKLEKVADAQELYYTLAKNNMNDPRPYLYLAEVFLSVKKYDENKSILDKVDHTYWLYKIENLVRKITLEEAVHLPVDEKSFGNDPILKSNYYRLYSKIYHRSNDKEMAKIFIEKAIQLNPNRFSNYDTKLYFLESRLFSPKEELKEPHSRDLNHLITEIEDVEKRFLSTSVLRDRCKAGLLLRKLAVYKVREDYKKVTSLVQEIFNLALNCYFDKYIEDILIGTLYGIYLPAEYLDRLVSYLDKTDVEISDNLSQVLIVQFNNHNKLFTEGKNFFNDRRIQKYLTFIDDIENNRQEELIYFLKDHNAFAIALADTLKELPELRKLILENLPEDKDNSKERLLLLFYSDVNDFESAFNILKGLELSRLRYGECRELLKVTRQKKAWEFEIQLLERLQQYEPDPKILVDIQLELFNAHLNLNDYLSAINIGTAILSKQAKGDHISSKNKEAILAHTIQCYLKRGQDKEACDLLSQYKFLSITPQFKISIETEVFLRNRRYNVAFSSVVEAVRVKKRLSPEEYASLFYLLIQIDKEIHIGLKSAECVETDSFVKLLKYDRWFYIGEGDELDASKIDSQNSNYKMFIGKRVGENIDLSSRYTSEINIAEIEVILPADKYIFWQTKFNFEQLTKEDRWDGTRRIEVPNVDDSIDTQYLEAFFQDQWEKAKPLFELYCSENVPLALLAINEGGLGQAISRIAQERKGFVKCSTGVNIELETQKKVAIKVIDENLPFYIDGTSALVLSEIGFLQKIYHHISNIKIPQSVIGMLLDLANRFRTISGEGTLGYARGQIIYSKTNKRKDKEIEDNFRSSIEILETRPDRIIKISAANKIDCLSENKVYPELCDGCILAQKEEIPLMTEDYLYLQMNEYETNKKVPEYFSTIALMRVLYEMGYIYFEDYLEYFGYLSSYRFRFLTLNADDINKAIFGEGILYNVNIKNILKFNFPLTLSNAYGVTDKAAFNVLLVFLYRIIIDDSITVEVLEVIYAELIYCLPEDKNKKEFGRMLINVSSEMIKREFSIILSSSVQAKINALNKLTDIIEDKIIIVK